MKFEKEFLCDHDLFLALDGVVPDLAEVRLDMKRGEHHSEFSMFRYDVYFWRSDPKAPRKPEGYDLTPFDRDVHDMEMLRGMLGGEGAPELFALSQVRLARGLPVSQPATVAHVLRLQSVLGGDGAALRVVRIVMFMCMTLSACCSDTACAFCFLLSCSSILD